MMNSLTTPVLFLIFKRPDTTQLVFNEIRKAKPRALFIVSDGPREGNPDDEELCRRTRDIVNQVDWECTVYKRYNERNMGLRATVSTGIDWFFEHAEMGIILEDDCLPSQSFFRFCEELLNRYSDDERIMQISGSNFLSGKINFDASYYFSKINDIWGWATWRRAWGLYDVRMSTFPEFKEKNLLRNYIHDAPIRNWLMSYFEQDYNADGAKGLWSSQWAYAICSHNGLTIAPSVNLVANIGFSASGTNSADSFGPYGNYDRQEIGEISHPSFILPDDEADALRFEIIRKTDPRLLYAKRYWIRKFVKNILPEKFHPFVRKFPRLLGA